MIPPPSAVCKPHHHQAQQIEVRLNSCGRALDCEHKRAQQIDDKKHSGRVVLDRASQSLAPTFYCIVVNVCSIPRTCC